MSGKAEDALQTLTADQVRATVEASGMTHQDFAAHVGCGSSQMWKYQKEGLPPRMNRQVRANILELASQAGVLPQNARVRVLVQKLSKGAGTKGVDTGNV
jgi:hypothetical protein